MHYRAGPFILKLLLSLTYRANTAHEVGVFRYLHSGASARHTARLLDADGLGASPISRRRALSRLVCRHPHLVPAYAGPGDLFFERQLRLFVFVPFEGRRDG